jgi:hypothetical protein
MQVLVLGLFAAWCFCQGQVGEWLPVVSTVVDEHVGHTWRPRKWRQCLRPTQWKLDWR